MYIGTLMGNLLTISIDIGHSAVGIFSLRSFVNDILSVVIHGHRPNTNYIWQLSCIMPMVVFITPTGHVIMADER